MNQLKPFNNLKKPTRNCCNFKSINNEADTQKLEFIHEINKNSSLTIL